MKSVLKTIFITISLGLIFTRCEKASNKPVDIPDQAFLDALIDQEVDANGDGSISYGEAEEVSYLSIKGEFGTFDLVCLSRIGIKSLKGIEAFINLEYLTITCTELKSLNLEQNKRLETLNCWHNYLENLDVSGCIALEELSCWNNNLSSLDISNNVMLQHLFCSGNPLGELDVSKNTALTYLHCSTNQLSALNLSNNHLLDQLYCSDNQLTSLDISQNIALLSLGISDMSTLHEVCVWTMPFPPAGLTLFDEDSPNIYFTTECSR